MFASRSTAGRSGLRSRRALWKPLRRLLAVGLASAALTACQHHDAGDWKLTDVSGHLPDLHFALTGDSGQTVTDAALHGDITLLFFGYTHCPDVCPETMARLAETLQKLGSDADHIRIVFVSVDPHRDTPALLHAYVQAFDPGHAIGVTGSDAQIADLARSYRVAYELGQPDAQGNYEVTHSAAVYIFDGAGHARLIATDNDTVDSLVHDLHELVHQG
jgi:protein SCO1